MRKRPGSGSGIQYVKSYFRYMVTGNPQWDVLTADIDASYGKRSRKPQQRDQSGSDPRFHARGHELIIYHGWVTLRSRPGTACPTTRTYKKMGEIAGSSQP